jgi:Predicted sugar phosphatases of the HAD superfamily
MGKIGFAIDMDGTIYKGNDLIPGAVEFIRFLKTSNIPFLFLTNNSSNTKQYYVAKLRRMGFDVSENDILTSAVATAQYIKNDRKGKKAFLLATPDVTAELSSMGVDISDSDPDMVLLTFDRTITFDKINKAYHFIVKGAELIATHPDDLCPTEEAYDVDIGPFIRLFESLTGKKALVIGKPNKLMLKMAASKMDIDEDEVIMVGDRLYTDMRMAHDAGTRSIMVLTGEARAENLEGSGIKPTHVIQSVGDIPLLIINGKI